MERVVAAAERSLRTHLLPFEEEHLNRIFANPDVQKAVLKADEKKQNGGVDGLADAIDSLARPLDVATRALWSHMYRSYMFPGRWGGCESPHLLDEAVNARTRVLRASNIYRAPSAHQEAPSAPPAMVEEKEGEEEVEGEGETKVGMPATEEEVDSDTDMTSTSSASSTSSSSDSDDDFE